MKISFVATVFNEEKSIDKFLNSIMFQTKKPDEVIIVDGGSQDKTMEKIKLFSKNHKNLNIKLYRKKGNIAKGRNFAIINSENSIILVSDVGCMIDRNWTKKMFNVFRDKRIDVAAGYYEPISNSIFGKCLSTYTSVMPDKIDEENFLPSSRSIGFRKRAWKNVGGYPEWLDTCEDLYFARELKRSGYKFRFVKDAVVKWPQRENVREAFIQFFNYSKGDGKARYFRKNTPFLFGRYIVGIFLTIIVVRSGNYLGFFIFFLLFIFYLIWAIFKNYNYVKNTKAIIYLPILQITSDIAVLLGTSIGFVRSLSVKKL